MTFTTLITLIALTIAGFFGYVYLLMQTKSSGKLSSSAGANFNSNIKVSSRPVGSIIEEDPEHETPVKEFFTAAPPNNEPKPVEDIAPKSLTELKQKKRSVGIRASQKPIDPVRIESEIQKEIGLPNNFEPELMDIEEPVLPAEDAEIMDALNEPTIDLPTEPTMEVEEEQQQNAEVKTQEKFQEKIEMSKVSKELKTENRLHEVAARILAANGIIRNAPLEV